ncbi:DUF7283 family protein [Halosegnis marinus]|uniref:Uncharacterized protein n=1 Tax=Halosegnis marinus TaxID=3034023 RepID=A0ABD5ZQC0_9EURY|nr:hypothetical protein [Halosegnis sp. DT85]
MFDAPIDGWYAWLGASLVAAGALGVAAGLPTAPPPDAAGAARTVDSLAASAYAGSETASLDRADRIRLTPRGVSLRGPDGTAHADFEYGPVTPVRDDGPLAAVLAGEPPGDVFADPTEFAVVAHGARTGDPGWRAAPDRLRVRRVTWGGVDVTLVG